jgi:hypothetical protein
MAGLTSVPSMVQAVTSNNWVGSAQLYNILKPQYGSKLYQALGDQNLTGLMDSLGGWNPIAGIEYMHSEEDWLHQSIKCDADAGGAANAAVTLTVAAGYRYTWPSSAISPYLVVGTDPNGGTTNSVRLQDTIKFPNGVEAQVTAVSGNTFTVIPVVLGTAIPAVLTSDVLIITGNAHQEGTNQPLSQAGRVNRYVNNMQIIKESNKTTGTALGQEIWFQVPGLNGQMGYLYYYKGQNDAYKRCKNLREMALLTGQKITNTTLATAQETLTKTEGLIPAVQNYGNTTTYNGITGITKADFQTMTTDQLDKYRGAKENALFSGIKLRMGIDNFVSVEMQNGGVIYNAFDGKKDQYVNFSFKSFEMQGYTYHLKTYDAFNYQQILGAPGQTYSQSAVVIPMETGVASFGTAGVKETVPPLRMNYVSQAGAGGSYSRDWEEWKTGAANGTYTNENDSLQINWRSHFGFEIFAPARYVWITPA